MLPAVSLYSTVVAVHVAAVAFAFGPLLAYRWLPAGTAAAHAARRRLLAVVVERGAVVALAAGLYLAVDAEVTGEVWVLVPLVALVAIAGVVGAVMIPAERRLAEGGDAAEQRTVARAAAVCAALVLVAVFFMVTKAGA